MSVTTEVVLAHPLELDDALLLGLEHRPYAVNEPLVLPVEHAEWLRRRGLLRVDATDPGVPSNYGSPITIYAPNGTPLPARWRVQFDGDVSVTDDISSGMTHIRVTGGGGTGAVSSVNGKTGTVALSALDVGADPAGAAQAVAQSLLEDPDPFPQYLTADRAIQTLLGGEENALAAPAEVLRHGASGWPNRTATAAPVIWVPDAPGLPLPPTRLPGDVIISYTSSVVPVVPAYLLRQDFDAIRIDETPISTINSGDLGNTPFDSVVVPTDTTFVYDDARALPGRVTSARVATSAGVTALYARSTFTPVTTATGRIYVYLSALPTAALDIVDIRGGGATTRVGTVRIKTDGTVALTGAASQIVTTSAAVPVNDWVRIEWSITTSTSGGGIFAVSMATGELAAAAGGTASVSGQTTAAASIDGVHYGVITAAANVGPFWIAGTAVAASASFLGPITLETTDSGLRDSSVNVIANVPQARNTQPDPDPTPQPIATGEPVFMTTAEAAWLPISGNGYANAKAICDQLRAGSLVPDLVNPNTRAGSVALTGALMWMATGRVDQPLRDAVRTYICAAPGSAPVTADALGSIRAMGSLLAAVDVLTKGGGWNDQQPLPNLGNITWAEYLNTLEHRVLGTGDARWRTVADTATGDASNRGAAARYALTMVGVLRDDDDMIVRSVDLLRRYLGDLSKAAPFVADAPSAAPSAAFDAVGGRARTALQRAHDWAVANQVTFGIATTGIPSNVDGALWDARWEGAWEAMWDLADRLAVPVTVSRASDQTLNRRAYTNHLGGHVDLDTVTSVGTILERHLSQADARGVVYSGAETGVAANGWDMNPRPGTPGQQYDYPTQGSWAFLASRGVTTVRLPVRWERLQPTLTSPLDATEQARLLQALNWAAQNHIKVIIDLNNFGGYSHAPGEHVVLGQTIPAGYGVGPLADAFVDFWQRMAVAFRGHAALGGYGLMHEPHDLVQTTTSDGTLLEPFEVWQHASNDAALAIRQIDSAVPLYVAGYNRSTCLDWVGENGPYAWLVSYWNGKPLNQDPHVVFEGRIMMDADGSYTASYDFELAAALEQGFISGTYPLPSATASSGYDATWDNTSSPPSRINAGVGFVDAATPGRDGVPLVDAARSGSNFSPNAAFYGAFGEGLIGPLLAADFLWAHTAVLMHLGYRPTRWSQNAVHRVGLWLGRARAQQSGLNVFLAQEARDPQWRAHRWVANWLRGGAPFGPPVPTATGVAGLPRALPVADWIASGGSQWLRAAALSTQTQQDGPTYPGPTTYPGPFTYPQGV
jgi:hypothetical protein